MLSVAIPSRKQPDNDVVFLAACIIHGNQEGQYITAIQSVERKDGLLIRFLHVVSGGECFQGVH
jgi:hypothetical protein